MKKEEKQEKNWKKEWDGMKKEDICGIRREFIPNVIRLVADMIAYLKSWLKLKNQTPTK